MFSELCPPLRDYWAHNSLSYSGLVAAYCSGHLRTIRHIKQPLLTTLPGYGHLGRR
jgi:hypothetical protein